MTRPHPGLFKGGFPQYLDTFWDDVILLKHVNVFGVSDPTVVQWPANGGAAYRFASTNVLGFGAEMPHWWKVGTDGKLHIHWTPQAYGVAENGNTVNWRVDLEIIAVNAASVGVTTYVCTATCPNQDDGHLIQGATVDVDLSALSGISGWITGRAYRAAGDSWSSAVPAEQPYLLQVGMHLQRDMPGSRQEYIK